MTFLATLNHTMTLRILTHAKHLNRATLGITISAGQWLQTDGRRPNRVEAKGVCLHNCIQSALILPTHCGAPTSRTFQVVVPKRILANAHSRPSTFCLWPRVDMCSVHLDVVWIAGVASQPDSPSGDRKLSHTSSTLHCCTICEGTRE